MKNRWLRVGSLALILISFFHLQSAQGQTPARPDVRLGRHDTVVRPIHPRPELRNPPPADPVFNKSEKINSLLNDSQALVMQAMIYLHEQEPQVVGYGIETLNEHLVDAFDDFVSGHWSTNASFGGLGILATGLGFLSAKVGEEVLDWSSKTAENSSNRSIRSLNRIQIGRYELGLKEVERLARFTPSLNSSGKTVLFGAGGFLLATGGVLLPQNLGNSSLGKEEKKSQAARELLYPLEREHILYDHARKTLGTVLRLNAKGHAQLKETIHNQWVELEIDNSRHAKDTVRFLPLHPVLDELNCIGMLEDERMAAVQAVQSLLEENGLHRDFRMSPKPSPRKRLEINIQTLEVLAKVLTEYRDELSDEIEVLEMKKMVRELSLAESPHQQAAPRLRKEIRDIEDNIKPRAKKIGDLNRYLKGLNHQVGRMKADLKELDE